MKQSMKQSNTREQVELENPQGGNKSDIGPTMSGSDILVAALEREAVDTIFAYPGGASMELHQALTRSDQIRVILPRHEQGGSFAAEGYARASGKPGVCMATSGPGATNLVTGIADAFMDSIPLIVICGQTISPMLTHPAIMPKKSCLRIIWPTKVIAVNLPLHRILPAIAIRPLVQ